jgi:hypothetical protein
MFTRIYALAVCFASILCIAISTGIGLYDIVQISFPELTMDSYLYQNLQSNERFRRSQQLYDPRVGYPIMMNERGMGIARANSLLDSTVKESSLTEKEINARREAQLATAIGNVRHDAQKSLVQILVILLVSVPLFFVHWRFARKLDARI